MTAPDYEPQAVRRQLERALASANFVRSERLSRFLRFVVECHLEGRDDELKESVIAIEVFGHRDYDPQQDSIVRTEAGRLRARLAEYYVGPGSSDPVIFELPKGGYVPVFRRLEEAPSERKTRPRRLWLLASLAGCAFALAAIGWWWAQHKAAPIAIAVVPLENLSHDPASDYFADGLTDEIIRNLSIIDGLAPRSRTSSFAFKGKPRNVHDVGKQLDADYVLEGSVLRSGQQLRINVQLIRVRDDLPIWSGKFDNRELTDVFAIQEEISRGIVNTLRLKLGRGRRRYETSTEAYDLYLRARALPFHSFRSSIAPFEEAIAKDPAFAPAYAGLAATYAYESGFAGDRNDELSKMRGAAERAIQLDPLLAEAHEALGMSYARDGQWVQSERSFHRAIELDSNSSTAYSDFAMDLLLPLGRIEDAVRQMRLAEKADRLSPHVHEVSAYVLLSAGRYDEAGGHCPKSSDPTECLGRVRLAQGRIDEAVQILAAAPNPRYFGHALGRAGHREEAEKLAATVARNPFQQALIYAGLGDKDRTFEALDRMTVQGPVRIGRALTFPEFSLVHGDPRVKALRKKVGLPE